MTDRPNILFIQVDQLTAQTLKSYGMDLSCANADALAANGWCLKRPIAISPVPHRGFQWQQGSCVQQLAL